MAKVGAITTIDLSQPACCIEFSTLYPDTFVIGTYLLNSDTFKDWKTSGGDPDPSQIRSGELVFYQLKGNEIIEGRNHKTAGAVLDLHFRPRSTGLHASSSVDVLGAVTSTGHLEIFALDSANPTGRFLHRFSIAPEDVVITSLAWRPYQSSETNVLAMTLSSLKTVLCEVKVDIETPVPSPEQSSDVARPKKTWLFGKTGGPNLYGEDQPTAYTLRLQSVGAEPVESIHQQVHAEYPWITSIDSSGRTLFVGDDGAQFLAFNLSTEWELASQTSPIPVNALEWNGRQGHEAGVTAILLIGDFVVTGSYDYHVRIFSQHSPKPPLTQMRFGETVWRLKLLCKPIGDFSGPASADRDGMALMLATCMREGTRILSVIRHGGHFTIKVVATFNEHAEHINYASDVQPGDGFNGDYRIVSISFYGKKLSLWKWQDRFGR